jgi:DNA-binding response OmpR family regulator
VSLTPLETRLLEYMRSNALRDISRPELVQKVWPDGRRASDRAVDTAVARLRRKARLLAVQRGRIDAVSGVGYRFVPSLKVGEGIAGARELSSASGASVGESRARVRLRDRCIDLARRTISGDGADEALTRHEHAAIQRLAESAGSLVCTQDLVAAVWEGRLVHPQALSNLISRIRRKIERDPSRPRHLITVKGSGYRLDANVETATANDQASASLWALAQHVGTHLALEDCVIYARRNGQLIQCAAFGHKSPKAEQIINPLVLPVGSGIVGAAASTGATQLVHDTRRDERYVSDVSSGLSELAVPIKLGDEVVGVIDSERPQVEGFTHAHRAAFESLAAIAAFSATKVRLEP